ncbi:MAG: hypothetical protein IV085_08675 [Thiobacillus sp.]|nr:hypothetical protein [Thiobacillus sp.]
MKIALQPGCPRVVRPFRNVAEIDRRAGLDGKTGLHELAVGCDADPAIAVMRQRLVDITDDGNGRCSQVLVTVLDWKGHVSISSAMAGMAWPSLEKPRRAGASPNWGLNHT